MELVTTWFAHCYRVDVDPVSGRAEWRQTAMPAAGGLGEQDARLTHGLRECARIGNELLEADRREHELKRKRERDGGHRPADQG